MMTSTRAAYLATQPILRRIRRPRRFQRGKLAGLIGKPMKKYWMGGIESLFEYLDQNEGWARLAQFVRGPVATAIAKNISIMEFEKTLSSEEREFLTRLLNEWGYYGDVDQVAAALVQQGRKEVYEAASTFALAQLGVSADFNLRNERILDALKARGQADVFATRKHVDRVFDTIIRNFYDLGSNPYDRTFLDELKRDLGYKTDYEAKRFALTETGIAAESAQIETWRRSGVTQKMWRILGQNTRPSHQALEKVKVGIDEKFLVGGYEADHPLDPTLPPEELINCHCWSLPVVGDDFRIEAGRVWDGA